MRTRNLIIAGAVALATSTTFTSAAEAAASKQENLGVGTGLVVGAVAGGPVGAIVGAAIGATLGNAYHVKDERVDTLTAELEDSHKSQARLSARLGRLDAINDELDAELQKMKAMARPQLLALLEAGIEMDLLFRTDEHVLLDDTENRVSEMAATLASMPDVYVKIDGYSDERGDADYNRKLSERRADHVRDVLVAGGLPEGRIRVSAHGESPAADPSADSYALERRVSLTLFVADSPSVAASR